MCTQAVTPVSQSTIGLDHEMLLDLATKVCFDAGFSMGLLDIALDPLRPLQALDHRQGAKLRQIEQVVLAELTI